MIDKKGDKTGYARADKVSPWEADIISGHGLAFAP